MGKMQYGIWRRSSRHRDQQVQRPWGWNAVEGEVRKITRSESSCGPDIQGCLGPGESHCISFFLSSFLPPSLPPSLPPFLPSFLPFFLFLSLSPSFFLLQGELSEECHSGGARPGRVLNMRNELPGVRMAAGRCWWLG